MKPADKQAYLEEYELLKKKGKPFFPYAVLKDSAMALIVVGVIIVMSLILGAEQGPKADPTTTTYVPRPEWYFFFLFEVLRVIKPPELVPIATIGIPTVCMVLLLLLPFYDRGPERHPGRRPLATTAGCLTIAAMAYLTYLGATGGSPTEIDMKVAPRYEAGKEIVAGSGCLACHKLGENGNNGPGPELTHIGSRVPRAAIIRSVEIGPGIMPSFRDLPQKKIERARRFPLLARLAGAHGRDHQALQGLRPVRGAGQPHVRPRRRSLRRAQLGDDRRPPPPLARARRGPRRTRPGRLRARRLLRHRRPGPRAGRPGRPRRPRGRLRLLRADARPCPREGRRRAAPRASASSGPTPCSCPTTPGRFDAVTVGFGIRNLADLDRGLARWPGSCGPAGAW